MKSADIREKFLKFFENNQHTRVKSSSLIPAADPTLLFTNAGMVQFKDCFLGRSDLGFTRATTSQKCVRAGGKHNDLENVGFTPRHHTFFEMLGNFSFGDYFKKEAIAYAWELLTKHYHLPKDRLQITVFEKDDEAEELWKAVGVPAQWITRLGEKDNFWAMGDTGPCGPCTEIYFDWGKEAGCGKPSCINPGCPCGGRFLEIWNLVFMQFNRDISGTLTPLPKPSVDTGSGLERVAAVLQGKKSNYDTDIFQPLLQAIAKRVGTPYGQNPDLDISMRVIADHLRSGTFLLTDGVLPSNEGRGYVLRRILRRAIRHGKKLGQERAFIYELVPSVIAVLGEQYPELVAQKSLVQTLLKEEEDRFHETLHRGMGLLDETIARVKKRGEKILPGEVTFKLYDTFGFPLDLVQVIAQEHSLSVDEVGYETLMSKQRSLSTFKGAQASGFNEAVTKTIESKKISDRFSGYESLNSNSQCLALFEATGKSVTSLSSGSQGFAIFDVTPFYAESGGQVGDQGNIIGKGIQAEVSSTNKIAKVTVHSLSVSQGNLREGDSYTLNVNEELRKQTAINHTSTHMLHAALRSVLGDRVKQAGSLVDSERLRFDFTFPRAVSSEEIQKIEAMVNAEVWKSQGVSTKEMNFDQAIQSGALAFFDEKYGAKVRVVQIGEDKGSFSTELCGGTHLKNTADIGLFKILSESSIASGIRRIEAVTSKQALSYLSQRDHLLSQVESKLGSTNADVTSKLDHMIAQNRTLQKEMENLKLKLAQSGTTSSNRGGGNAEKPPEQVGNIKLIAEKIPDANPKILRTLVDQLRDKHKEKTVVLLATETDGKVALCVGVTKDLVTSHDAAKLVKEIAPLVAGSGGGRGDFAQAGGTDPAGVPAAIKKIRELLSEMA